MRFAWFQYRLLTNHAFAFYFTYCAVRIEDLPVAAKQTYCIFTVVLNADLISKHKVLLPRAGIIREVIVGNRYLNALSGLGIHIIRKVRGKFLFSKRLQSAISLRTLVLIKLKTVAF